MFSGCRAWEADEAPADFSYADLREAVFERCDVSMASFHRARAYDLSLSECQAQGADFSQLDTRLPVQTRTPMVRCTMSRCNLSYADLARIDLTGADLSGSRLLEANLDECCLRDADLRDADLNNVSGRGFDIAGADLRGAVFNNLDPRHLDLQGVRIRPEQVPLLLEPVGVVIED